MCVLDRNRSSRNLLRIGMLLLAAALTAQHFLRPPHGVGEDAVDAISGLLIGLSIGLNVWAVRLAASSRRS